MAGGKVSRAGLQSRLIPHHQPCLRHHRNDCREKAKPGFA